MAKKLRPSDILQRVRTRLTPEGSWCQGTLYLDKDGRQAETPKEAVSYCLVGALHASAQRIGYDVWNDAREYLRTAIITTTDGFGLTNFNDLQDTTHEKVLEVIDIAIEHARMNKE